TRHVLEFAREVVNRRLGEFALSHAALSRQPFVADGLAYAVIPELMMAFKPKILILHQTGHDAAHGNGGYPRAETGFSEYERVVRTTDEQIGRIFDFVRNDPYFPSRTTILIRPEVGRDDEMTPYGELHHSTGYYQTHHSAEIWWGPDIRVGVDKGLKNRRDVVPTLTRLFNVDARYAHGQVHSSMFKNSGVLGN